MNYTEILSNFSMASSKSSLNIDELCLLYRTIDEKLHAISADIKIAADVDIESLSLNQEEKDFVRWYRRLLNAVDTLSKDIDGRDEAIVYSIVMSSDLDSNRLSATETRVYAKVQAMYNGIAEKLNSFSEGLKVGHGEIEPHFGLSIQETSFIGFYRNLLRDADKSALVRNIVKNIIKSVDISKNQLVEEETRVLSTRKFKM